MHTILTLDSFRDKTRSFNSLLLTFVISLSSLHTPQSSNGHPRRQLLARSFLLFLPAPPSASDAHPNALCLQLRARLLLSYSRSRKIPPLLLLALLKTCRKLTSESSGPSRSSSSSISNFKQSPAFKYCSILAITFLSRAFQLLPCTSMVGNCTSSIDECELCRGAGGIILLLEVGSAFTGAPSSLISS